MKEDNQRESVCTWVNQMSTSYFCSDCSDHCVPDACLRWGVRCRMFLHTRLNLKFSKPGNVYISIIHSSCSFRLAEMLQITGVHCTRIKQPLLPPFISFWAERLRAASGRHKLSFGKCQASLSLLFDYVTLPAFLRQLAALHLASISSFSSLSVSFSLLYQTCSCKISVVNIRTLFNFVGRPCDHKKCFTFTCVQIKFLHLTEAAERLFSPHSLVWVFFSSSFRHWLDCESSQWQAGRLVESVGLRVLYVFVFVCMWGEISGV